MSDLPKADLLHTMQIGMLDHLAQWIIHFMKTHKRLNKYNAMLLSVPAYHDLTPKTNSYGEVSQWNGKEMKEMSRYVLGVVTQSLPGGSPTQHPIFNRAIECTWALLEFFMYARYKSDDDATLNYMEDALCRFHTFKDVCVLGQAGKKVKAKANALRMIFPKIHLMSHWVEQIRRYGALQQNSAQRHEPAHKTNLNDGWNASNHKLNCLPQVITFEHRIVCFEIRERNLQAVAQC